ncbi:SIS domain-containing protein [Faecalimonas umbilicata]|uniref:SIS domain-containing protein n=1 Tax=Faecalimonas umbilicata TaxID=1912855 RepID=UPI002ED16FE4
MCGIIGFAGKTEAVPILLDGLERLEYRGYDSAGVAVVSADGRLQVKKSKGRLSVLRELLDSQNPLSGNIGIGHTRWATHGEPNDTNAHPHVGQEGKIAVVHNGIIENYLEIKNSLIRKGVVFSSDTDTEVIVQLLEYYYRKKFNLMDAVYAVLNRIKGAYAMGILCSDFPGQMVAARKDAPLLIGYGQEGNYIASDVTALLAHTRTVTYMEDDEVAVITADDVQIFDRDRFLLEKEKHLIEWDVSAAEKYVAIIRELQDLPEKISVVMNDLDLYQKAASRYFNHNSVFYIGRNLDYALGLEGSLKLKEISYIHSESYAAGELKHGTISLIEPGTLVVAMVTYEPLVEKSLSNIVEVKSRGAEVIAMTTDQTAELISSQASEIFVIPKPHSLLQPVLGVIPLQLFTYYVALNRGCDIISQGIWQNRSQ